MVAVTQDVKWAFAGQPVVLEASSLSGDRARFKLTAKPYDSALELYDANDENYFDILTDTRSKITPDVPGIYTITCMDEDVTINVKHFSNDGGTGLSKGIVTATALASTSYSLVVGDKLQRQFGFGQDTCTLTVHVHNQSALSGVMTYYAGEGYCGTLTGSTSPVMDLAIRSTGVARVMGYYGMSSGYTNTANVITWSNWFELSATQLARIVLGFNRHITYTTAAVHDAADTTNKMSGVTKPSTVTGVVTYANTFRGKVIAHLGLSAAVAHPFGPDSSTTITVGTATSLNTARLLLINLRSGIDAHRIVHTTSAHYSPGDNESDVLTPWYAPNQNDSTSVVISYATAVASTWDAHLANNYSAASSYHTATGSDNEMYSRTSVNWDELKDLANDCADRFEAHGGNRVAETGSAGSYHSEPDKSAVVPFRASDRLSTVQLIDYLHWAYLNHVLYGAGNWHNSRQNAGAAYVEPYYASTRLQHALLDRLSGRVTSTPPNTMEAVDSLINRAGFTRAS